MDASLHEVLSANDYPGRGLVLARTPRDGICVAYFMTGRSPASRDRILVRDKDALFARPRNAPGHDPLRHYRAVTVGPDWCVTGNGDQVDTVTGNLGSMHPAQAVQGISFEPDPPLRTPRITVITPRRPGPMLMAGSRASVLDPARTHVSTVTAADMPPGGALLTTTYLSRGRQVISTSQPPAEVTADADGARELLAAVWSALPADLRVAAAVVQPHAADPLQVPPCNAG
ncbi:MAG TPA: IMP cyclohydrolase [Trebonia sp.]|jgi:hypothetical protein|nr:IMP cyclohydrolase [Trebonia sp.]